MRQKTIGNEVSFSGIGVHTGNKVEAVVKPAPADHGIIFVRKDLDPEVSIKADIYNVNDVLRGTALQKGDCEIFTVEHILAACAGLGIYNLIIELSSNEFPVGDGSSKPFVEMLENAGIRELDKEQEVFEVKEIIEIVHEDTFIVIKPCNTFRISFTIDYDHPVIGSQYLSLDIDEHSFKNEIMFARTFGFYRDYEKLKERNKAGGSSLDNTITLNDEKVLNAEGLRRPDEFVRHKILDLIGDFSLIGHPMKGHVIAVKVGHMLNVEASKKIREQMRHEKMKMNVLDVDQIKDIIPHRYPFLLVDKIVEMDGWQKAVGIKNITVNEEFFQGHFPVRPVMPGVLIVEALAQVAGVLLLSKPEYRGHLPYFVGIDKVRIRRPVRPGDILSLEVTVLKLKGKMGKVRGVAQVDGELAASGELMFSIVK
ncbi:MAG: bifunctional UDP-3-O-[3-hydroxymyristoyl] N-acetylglucosamine deacetylase/3-hydroxyacyl-ACP dehydratase [Candidatus Muiribacteriaceae bacterium]